jgi:flavodoxin
MAVKTLIVYASSHRMNTRRVARAMGEATGATLMTAAEAGPADLDAYDLVGLGSGIYGGRHHPDLLALADGLAPGARDVFLFSTAAGLCAGHHRPLREALETKGCRVRGEFQCLGEYRFLRVIVRNRGHPDDAEIADARRFARGLVAGTGAGA